MSVNLSDIVSDGFVFGGDGAGSASNSTDMEDDDDGYDDDDDDERGGAAAARARLDYSIQKLRVDQAKEVGVRPPRALAELHLAAAASPSEDLVQIGNTFSSRAELAIVVAESCQLQRRDFRLVRCDSFRWEVCCSSKTESSCGYCAVGTFSTDTGMWTLTKLKRHNSCVESDKCAYNLDALARIVAKDDKLEANPKESAKSMAALLRLYIPDSQRLNNSQICRIKKAAMKLIHGSEEDEIAKLGAYRELVGEKGGDLTIITLNQNEAVRYIVALMKRQHVAELKRKKKEAEEGGTAGNREEIEKDKEALAAAKDIVKRVLDTFNKEEEDRLLKQKCGEQSIATFQDIVVRHLAADEDFAGEEGEQDAEKVVRAVFSHEVVKRIKTWKTLMNKVQELLPLEILGKSTDFDEKAATKEAQAKVDDAVNRGRSRAKRNRTDPDGKAEIKFVVGLSFVPRWVVTATNQKRLIEVCFCDAAHMTGPHTLYSTITADGNRKNVGMAYSIFTGKEGATGWSGHHGIMVERIESVVSPDRRVIGDGNSSLRNSVLANGMKYVRCGKHMEKVFPSKNDKDTFKAALQAATVEELEDYLAKFSSKAQKLLKPESRTGAPKEELYPVCAGNMFGYTNQSPVEAQNSAHLPQRRLHMAAAMLRIIDGESKRIETNKKEALAHAAKTAVGVAGSNSRSGSMKGTEGSKGGATRQSPFPPEGQSRYQVLTFEQSWKFEAQIDKEKAEEFKVMLTQGKPVPPIVVKNTRDPSDKHIVSLNTPRNTEKGEKGKPAECSCGVPQQHGFGCPAVACVCTCLNLSFETVIDKRLTTEGWLEQYEGDYVGFEAPTIGEIRVRHEEMCNREGGLDTLYLPLPLQGKKRGGQQKKRFKGFKERFQYNKRLKNRVVRIKRNDGQGAIEIEDDDGGMPGASDVKKGSAAITKPGYIKEDISEGANMPESTISEQRMSSIISQHERRKAKGLFESDLGPSKLLAKCMKEVATSGRLVFEPKALNRIVGEGVGDRDKMLCDETIMSFSQALNAKNKKQQQSRSQGSATKQTDIVDAYFFNSFLVKKIVDAPEKDAYTQAKGWLSGKDLDRRDVIVFPVHLANPEHWKVVLACPSRGELWDICSLQAEKKQQNCQVMSRVSTVLCHMGRETKSSKLNRKWDFKFVRPPIVPSQDEDPTVSCGFFVLATMVFVSSCNNIKQVINGDLLGYFHQKDVPTVRTAMANMMRPYAIAPAAAAGGQEGVTGLKKGGRKVESNKRGSETVVEIEDEAEEGGEEGWEEEGEQKPRGGKKPKTGQTAKELCGANAMSDRAGEGQRKRKLDRDEEVRPSKKK